MNMDSNEVLPRHFDAAAKWPGMIHEPLDQGNCAGSWAFSTAGEMRWDRVQWLVGTGTTPAAVGLRSGAGLGEAAP